MPLRIRLTRMGKKKQPSYRVVVVDSRKPRDGAYIEQIGRYDPRQEPSIVEIDNDRALSWLQNGAQPSERARKLLEISGAWGRFRVARGEIHTIDETPEAPAGDTGDAAEPAPPDTDAEPEPKVAEEPEPVAAEEQPAAATAEAAESVEAETEDATPEEETS